MNLTNIPTPALLIDYQRLRLNIERMQKRVSQQGVKLRPHLKTHKSVNIAQIQRQIGAQGITVAKVSEAEVFAQAGFDDICIAFPVMGELAWQRLLNLQQQAQVSILVDTITGAKALSDYCHSQQKLQSVLMEVDVGHGRTGIRWDDPKIAEFYQLLWNLPGLEVKGVLTHAGQCYSGGETVADSPQFVQQVAVDEQQRMQKVALKLQEAKLEIPEISIGSTPTATYFQASGTPKITELRPGNYVFYDLEQVALGSATLSDCALSVLTTVVSRHDDPEGTKLFLDAGKKALETETHRLIEGYGLLVDIESQQPYPDTVLFALSEEHGWVKTVNNCPLQVGDRVRIIPVHACIVANLFDFYYVVEGRNVVDQWQISARGCST